MRRVRAGLLIMCGCAALPTGVAAAATSALPDAMVTNGLVTAVATDSQGRAYIGGAFDRIGPRYGHLLSLTTTSSAAATGFPDFNGPVHAAVSDGSGGAFVGGEFSDVGGVARSRLAHIRADGSLDPDWNPNANNTVRALVLSGGSLYAGGDFTQVGGLPHVRVVKLSAAGTGTPDPAWLGAESGAVRALAVIGDKVYAAGSFAPHFLERLSTTDGSKDPSWIPSPDGPVFALAVSGTDLFVGGDFVGMGPDTRFGLAKIDTTTGPGASDANWKPGQGIARALLVSGSSIYVGGYFVSIGGNSASRTNVARLSTATTGDADSWNPGADGLVAALAPAGDGVIVGGEFATLGGQARRYLGKVSTAGSLDGAWDPAPNGFVAAIAAAGTKVYAGGVLSSAGPQNVVRNNIARLNADGSLDPTWHPDVSGLVNALALGSAGLYVGGFFVKVGGASHSGLARIGTDGTVDASWHPQVSLLPPDGVRALALAPDDSLYVGGTFDQIDAVNSAGLALLTPSGALDATWNPLLFPVPPVAPRALALADGSLYVGGDFTGAVWNTEAGAMPLSRLVKVSATGAGIADSTWMPNPTAAVNALALSGGSIYVGGAFTKIGGVARNRIAKLSVSGTTDPAWNPDVNGTVFAIAPAGDSVYFGGPFSTAGGQARGGLARASATGVGAVDPGFVPQLGGGGPVAAIGVSASRLFVGGVFDAFGPLSTTGLALFDLRPPTASIATPAEGARYRQGQVTSAAYSCSDPDGASNVGGCAGPAANGSPIDTATAGPHTFTVTATDLGGNEGTTTTHYVVDSSAPSINLEAGVYDQDQVVAATYSCADADGDADIASCVGTVPVGSPIDTSVPGGHNFTVNAADLAGNTATKTVTYLVRAKPPTTTSAAEGHDGAEAQQAEDHAGGVPRRAEGRVDGREEEEAPGRREGDLHALRERDGEVHGPAGLEAQEVQDARQLLRPRQEGLEEQVHVPRTRRAQDAQARELPLQRGGDRRGEEQAQEAGAPVVQDRQGLSRAAGPRRCRRRSVGVSGR